MLKKVFYTFLARFGTMALTLVTAILISNYLGDAGRGEQALILLGISLICLFTNLSSGGALVILAPQYNGKALLFLAYTWITGSALAGWIILGFFGQWNNYGMHILFTSILFSFWSANANYLLGREKNKWFNLLNFLQAFILVLYLLIIAYTGKLTLLSYIYALYISHAAALLISIVPTLNNLSEGISHKKEIFYKFIRHGGFTQLANIAQLLKYRFNIYLIEIYLGLSMVGLYANALAVAEGIWLITRSISIVQFAKMVNTGDTTVSRKITVQYTWLSLGISIAAMLVLLLVPDEVFTFIFGKDFVGIHDLLVYLSPAIIALSGSNIISHYFSGTGKTHVNFIGSAIGLLCIIALGYLLVPGYGLKGAAMASSISFIVTMLFHVVWFRLSGNFKESPKDH